MHIPDGFVSNPLIWGSFYAISIGIMSIATFKIKEVHNKYSEPSPNALIDIHIQSALTGAFVFAAQMFNFPIAVGTSGHLTGAALACFLLGGYQGILVTSFVIILQSLLFQDGGITALGMNIFNMSLVSGGLSFAIYHAFRMLFNVEKLKTYLVFLSVFIGVILASISVSAQLSLSKVFPFKASLFAMVLVHIPIALVEASITSTMLSTIHRLKPSLAKGLSSQFSIKKSHTISLLFSILLAISAVFFASDNPDGLEYVSSLFKIDKPATFYLNSPFPDYNMIGYIGNKTTQVVVALLGISITLFIILFFFRLTQRKITTSKHN